MTTSDEDALRLYEQGASLLLTGQYDEALQRFGESLEKENHHRTLHAIGECHMKMGNYDKAIEPLTAAVALDKNARPAALLAECFYYLNDLAQARTHALTALERMPHYARVRKLLEHIDVRESQPSLTDSAPPASCTFTL